jgi:hypothetical protein
MDHDDIRHKLSEYIDDAVTPGEKEAIEAHLAACGECSDALRELRKTIEHVRAVEEIEPPAWLTRKVMARVRETAERRKGMVRAVLDHFALLRPARVVAVLFLVVIAYTVYKTAPVREKLAETPTEVATKEAQRKSGREERAKGADEAARRGQVEQKPAYRSLDIKYAYEKPETPGPAAPPAAETARPMAAGEPPASPEERGAGMVAKARRPAAPARSPEPLMQDKLESAPAGHAPAAKESAGESEPVHAPRAADAEQELFEQKRLIAHFLAHDLPADMQAKETVFVTQAVSPASPELHEIDAALRKHIGLCRKGYMVEARLSARQLRYFYCYGPRIVLLGKYEFKGDRWIKEK